MKNSHLGVFSIIWVVMMLTAVNSAQPAVNHRLTETDVRLENGTVFIEFPPLADTLSEVTGSGNTLRRQIGVRRALDPAGSAALQSLISTKAAEPSGAHIEVMSPGAGGIRIGIAISSLADSTSFSFSGDLDSYLVEGGDVNALIQANLASEPHDPEASIYWSPVIRGERAAMEITLPQPSSATTFDITIAAISHLTTTPFSSAGEAGTCHSDVNCFSDWIKPGKSVVKMTFIESGISYMCTGTLLRDIDTTTTVPYLITAHHCISSQTVASSLQTVWQYRSSGCNSSTEGPGTSTLAGGATYLWGKGMSMEPGDNMDISLLRLNETTPAGIEFMEWSLAPITPGVQHFAIHHPGGLMKKIAGGYSEYTYDCWLTSATIFNCMPSANGNFILMNWPSAGTEYGSNGAGLISSSKRLVGVLSGGNGDVCAGSTSFFSSFAKAYAQGNFGKWLNTPGPEPKPILVTPVNHLLLKE